MKFPFLKKKSPKKPRVDVLAEFERLVDLVKNNKGDELCQFEVQIYRHRGSGYTRIEFRGYYHGGNFTKWHITPDDVIAEIQEKFDAPKIPEQAVESVHVELGTDL